MKTFLVTPDKVPLELKSHFPLKQAMLCLDCDTVSAQSDQCPACASRTLTSLESFLTPQRPDWCWL